MNIRYYVQYHSKKMRHRGIKICGVTIVPHWPYDHNGSLPGLKKSCTIPLAKELKLEFLAAVVSCSNCSLPTGNTPRFKAIRIQSAVALWSPRS